MFEAILTIIFEDRHYFHDDTHCICLLSWLKHSINLWYILIKVKDNAYVTNAFVRSVHCFQRDKIFF